MRSEDFHRELSSLNTVTWPDLTRPVHLYVGSRYGYTRGVVAHTRAAFLAQTRSLILREDHKESKFVGLVQPVRLSPEHVVEILRRRARHQESMFRDWLYHKLLDHKEKLGRLPDGFTEHPPTTPRKRGDIARWYDDEAPMFRWPPPGPHGPLRQKLHAQWDRLTAAHPRVPDRIRPSQAPVAPYDAEVFTFSADSFEGALGVSTFSAWGYENTPRPFFLFTLVEPTTDLQGALAPFYEERRAVAAANHAALQATEERRREEQEATCRRELEDLFR